MQLILKNIDISIGKKDLIKNLNCVFLNKDVCGILGPNGAGKTTLLHTLAGLHKPNNGKIFLDESDIHQLKHKSRAKKIGLLLQDSEFQLTSSVLETAITGRYPHSKNFFTESSDDVEITKQILNQLDLLELQDRKVLSLSGGEKRRLAMAKILIQDPEVYLLDEPTNHLDIKQQICIIDRLSSLAKTENKILIMILHDINLIRAFCNKVLLLGLDGKIIFGPCNEILNESNFSKIFPKDILKILPSYFS